MNRTLRDNGLSMVLMALFLVFWVGQSVTGNRQFNSEQREHNQPELSYSNYLRSDHFWEATAGTGRASFSRYSGM